MLFYFVFLLDIWNKIWPLFLSIFFEWLMTSHFSVSGNGRITTSSSPLFFFFPGMSIIFFAVTWEERCDLMVKSARKKLYFCWLIWGIRLCGSLVLTHSVKKCVLFSFPPMMYGCAHSFLQMSLNSSSISFSSNLVCFENVSYLIFKGKTE